MNKQQALNDLYSKWRDCSACGLCQERKNVVFGYGNPDAKVMVIGEAPGENEDREGVPFVGKAGKLLDQFLAQSSERDDIQELARTFNRRMSRDDMERLQEALREALLGDFYFSNVIGCRPPENRDPIPKEIEACRPRLMEQIYIIDPVLIIAAGRIAVEAFVGKKISVLQYRGQLFDVKIPGRVFPIIYPLMAVLHPSYLARKNDFRQKGGDGAKTYNDFIKSMNIIDEYNLIHHNIPIPTSRPRKEEM